MSLPRLRGIFQLTSLLPSEYESEYYPSENDLPVGQRSPAEQVLLESAACLTWSERLARGHEERADSAIERLFPLSTTRMSLLVHLATVDPTYFLLAKRMTASTLKNAAKRGAKLEPFLAVWASILLEAAEPKTRAKNIGHNVMIITAVASLTCQGWKATQSVKKAGRATERPSACQYLSDMLRSDFEWTMDYSAIEKVWKGREWYLERAGFERSEVLDYLARSSPMSLKLG